MSHFTAPFIEMTEINFLVISIEVSVISLGLKANTIFDIDVVLYTQLRMLGVNIEGGPSRICQSRI